MSLSQDQCRRLLKVLDSVECDLRRLEHRLTAVRREIHDATFGLWKLTDVALDGSMKADRHDEEQRRRDALAGM